MLIKGEPGPGTLCAFSRLCQQEGRSKKSHRRHHRLHHFACVWRPIVRYNREGERGLHPRLEGQIGIEGWRENGTVSVWVPRWGRYRPRSGVGTKLSRLRTRVMIPTAMGRCLAEVRQLRKGETFRTDLLGLIAPLSFGSCTVEGEGG